jgi:hypothetical protein
VFGWRLRGAPQAPSFSDGTGHVIGHWRTGLPAAGQAGVLPYLYVTRLDGTLRTAAEQDAQIVTRPTRKETLDSYYPRPRRQRHRHLAGGATMTSRATGPPQRC